MEGSSKKVISARAARPMPIPTAEFWPRESFLIRLHAGIRNSSTSSAASSASQLGKNMLAERGDLDCEVLRVSLPLADEAHAAEHRGVLAWPLPEDANLAAALPVLRREDRHGRGLTCAVAAEEAVDRVLLDVEAHVVEGEGVLEAFGEVACIDDRADVGTSSSPARH